jgi:bifunctional DNA-binding transcriptional regulator/antitoxin component of YhaV-PrlF toxin-antitoxin module
MTSWTVITEEDPETGEIIMPLPPEALAELGWQEGDVLEWKVDEEGRVTLTKKAKDESND